MAATNYPQFNEAVTELTDKVEKLLTNVGELQTVANIQVAKDKAAEATLAASSIKDSVARSEAARVAADAAKTEATTQAGKAALAEVNAEASMSAASASRAAAKVSEGNAKASETAAAGSATNAATSRQAAATSEANAKTSETNAKTSESTATNQRVAAEAAQRGAADSAAKAKTAEEAAAGSAAAAREAQQRAENAAGTVVGGLSEAGAIDLSSGKYPPIPNSSCFWKVTVAGTVNGIEYGVGDSLIYSKNLGDFYKLDSNDGVTSVNGRKGIVTLTPLDLGLDTWGMAGEAIVGDGLSLNDVPVNSFLRCEGPASNAATFKWPVTGAGATVQVAFDVITFGTLRRRTQLATEVFGAVNGRGRTFVRVCHDTTWYDWEELLRASSLKGTDNRISLTTDKGRITISAPQDLHPGAVPTFANLISANAPSEASHVVNRGYLDSLDAKQSARATADVELRYSAATASTLTGPAAKVVINGTTAAGSRELTNVVGAQQQILVGASVAGTGIPSGATVSAVNGTSVTLSAPATAAGTVSVTFTQSIGTLVVDGITLALNDRVLLRLQGDKQYNGLYTLSRLGNASTPWMLTRASDASTWDALVAAYLVIEEGVVHQDRMYQCNVGRGGTLGTHALSFQEILTDASTSVLRPGDFGLGGQDLPQAVNLNDTTLRTGWYTYVKGAGGPLNVEYGNVMVVSRQGASQWITQLFYAVGGRIYVRHNFDAEGWRAWATQYDTLTFDPDTKLNTAGGRLTGEVTTTSAIILNNSTTDSPELRWVTPGYTVNADVIGSRWRLYGSAAAQPANIFELFDLDMAARVGRLFGGKILTEGNLSLGSAASQNLATSGNLLSKVPFIGSDGVMEIGATLDFHSNNDSVDYQVRLQVDPSGTYLYYYPRVGAGGFLYHSGNFRPDSKFNVTGGDIGGRVDIVTNVGSGPVYHDGQLELRCTDGGAVSMGFHRGGYTACQLRHSGNGLILSGTSQTAAADLYTYGNVTAYSDVRLKTDIEVIPHALHKVCQLTGVTFAKTTEEAELGRRHTGVIAQELQAVLPEAVHVDEEGYLSVAYGNLAGLMIEAIKELRQEVQDLKRQLK